MKKLSFRLTAPMGSSIEASTNDEALNAELTAATTELVLDALRKMDWHPKVIEGRVPEVLSDATLAQIEALEAARAIRARREGRPVPPDVVFPTVEDGVAGVAFVEACVRSSERNAAWVSL